MRKSLLLTPVSLQVYNIRYIRMCLFIRAHGCTMCVHDTTHYNVTKNSTAKLHKFGRGRLRSMKRPQGPRCVAMLRTTCAVFIARQHSRVAERDTVIAFLFIYQSVLLLHAGIVLKRLNDIKQSSPSGSLRAVVLHAPKNFSCI